MCIQSMKVTLSCIKSQNTKRYPQYSLYTSKVVISTQKKTSTLSKLFTAEKRSFKLVLHLNKGEASRTVSSEEQGFEMLVVPAECELNAQEAKAVVTFWYRKRGEGQPPPRPLISQLVENLTTEKLVVSLDDLECRSVAISGGKGQSLALLRLMKSQQVK